MNHCLLIAHPGHEVRVHHWLETIRPQVFVLTDGSGGGGVSRLDGTRHILDTCGAPQGSVFGRFSDRALYEVIQQGAVAQALALAEDLAAEWERLEIESVSADMLEGFNTTHDFCRSLAGSVIERLRRKTGRQIANWDFPLEGLPDRMAHETPAEALRVLELDESAFLRKLEAASNYGQLRSEVDQAILTYGTAPFRREVFRKAPASDGLEWRHDKPPYYEEYGAKMVAAGRYQHVITFREHLQPLALALWDWAAKG